MCCAADAPLVQSEWRRSRTSREVLCIWTVFCGGHAIMVMMTDRTVSCAVALCWAWQVMPS